MKLTNCEIDRRTEREIETKKIKVAQDKHAEQKKNTVLTML